MRKVLTATFAATAVAAGTLGVCAPSAAASPAPAKTPTAQGSLAVAQAQSGLQKIQEQTSAVGGQFNYSNLIAKGVPQQTATQYAGYLKASGQRYTAPASAQPSIAAAAAQVAPQVRAEVVRTGVAAPAIDWGKVLRVAGSEVECLAIRETLLVWYPLAFCIPNPDNNSTWLVMIY